MSIMATVHPLAMQATNSLNIAPVKGLKKPVGSTPNAGGGLKLQVYNGPESLRKSEVSITPIANRVRSRISFQNVSTPPPKLEVFNDSVMTSAAALVNAKVKQLQDKENIPPPNSPVAHRVSRGIYARRQPLSLLAAATKKDEQEGDEQQSEEDNNDGHYVYLETQLAPQPGEEAEEEVPKKKASNKKKSPPVVGKLHQKTQLGNAPGAAMKKKKKMVLMR